MFPKSYVHPKTKRLHPRYWLNNDGTPKRRLTKGTNEFGLGEFCRIALPHLVDVPDMFKDEGDHPRAWDTVMLWMADNVNDPWYFWIRKKDQGYFAFANVTDAVHFKLWKRG